MYINKKILATAMAMCLPVAMLVAGCVTSWTPATSPGFANPSGYCDETCHSDSYAIDGSCGPSAPPGVSGDECSIVVVPYGYSEFEPTLHWDDEEEVWYCTCDEVYWSLESYDVPHIGFKCKGKPIANPSDPTPPPTPPSP